MIFDGLVMKMYSKRLLHRYDPDGTVFYFSGEDFPGLAWEDIEFSGDVGQKLCGRIYYRGEPRRDRLIFFDHGLGNGHAAYLREIELLTRRGYTVVSYDHTGTNRSEGENIRCFAQSLCDLDRCISYVKSLPYYNDASVSVIGHSWGGFSTMNIPSLHPEVTHVVPISGFIAAREIIKDVFKGPLSLYRRAAFKKEEEVIPSLAGINGASSLKNSSTKALIIHSKDDPVVNFDHHFGVLQRELAGCERIEFFEIDGKGHKPHYTKEGCDEQARYFCDLKKEIKSGGMRSDEERSAFLSKYDWYKITEQDEQIWDRICAFLEG